MEAADAMISKERRCRLPKAKGRLRGCSSRTTRPLDSASRLLPARQWEEQQTRQKRRAEAGAADSAPPLVSLAAQLRREKVQKRSKAGAAGGLGASKAVNNPSLLSFDEDDEP